MKTADIELSEEAQRDTDPATYPMQRMKLRADQEYATLAEKMADPARSVPEGAISQLSFKAGMFSGAAFEGLPDPMVDIVHQFVLRIGPAVDWTFGYAVVGDQQVLFATV